MSFSPWFVITGPTREMFLLIKWIAPQSGIQLFDSFIKCGLRLPVLGRKDPNVCIYLLLFWQYYEDCWCKVLSFLLISCLECVYVYL